MNTTAASQAAETTAANPKVLGGVAPYLSVRDASAAAEFYKRAFGAEEVARKSMQDHRLIHCHLYINGASVMLSDAFPEFGHPLKDPQGFNLLLAVDDVDAWWKRAVEAGAEIVMPLELQFWGDRYGQLRGPFGITWAMASPGR